MRRIREAGELGEILVVQGTYSQDWLLYDTDWNWRINDTFKQLFRRFYESIADPSMEPDYPQFADGLRQMRILEAALESNARRRWTEVTAFGTGEV